MFKIAYPQARIWHEIQVPIIYYFCINSANSLNVYLSRIWDVLSAEICLFSDTFAFVWSILCILIKRLIIHSQQVFEEDKRDWRIIEVNEEMDHLNQMPAHSAACMAFSHLPSSSHWAPREALITRLNLSHASFHQTWWTSNPCINIICINTHTPSSSANSSVFYLCKNSTT